MEYYRFLIWWDTVGDVDNVDGLEVDSCFGFGEGVVVEAVVAVFVGDYGLPSAASIIGVDTDDDNYDVIGVVVVCVERISPIFT